MKRFLDFAFQDDLYELRPGWIVRADPYEKFIGGLPRHPRDPVTIALVAGVGLSAYGQYAAGQAAKAEGKQAQEIANYNARLKEREAAAELARAREAARQFGLEGQELLASQQVNLAKGGVLTSTGTPAMLMETTAQELEADRKRILEEGFLAESFRMSEAEGLRYEGRAAKARGEAEAYSSTFKAAGTLLTGFGYYGKDLKWPSKPMTAEGKATLLRY